MRLAIAALDFHCAPADGFGLGYTAFAAELHTSRRTRQVSCKGALVAFNGKVILATSKWSGGDRFVIVYYSRALYYRPASVHSIVGYPDRRACDSDRQVLALRECGLEVAVGQSRHGKQHIMTEDIVFIMPCPDESFRVEVCEQDSPRRQAQLLAFRLL